MKFSTVLLASAAVLSGASARVIWTDYEPNKVCWKVCFHHEPECPHEWVRRKSPFSRLKYQNITNTSHVQHAHKFAVRHCLTYL